MRIGMLTGDGDCPGLNAVIRAVGHKGIQQYGDEFVGFMEGWRGVIDDRTMPLNLKQQVESCTAAERSCDPRAPT